MTKIDELNQIISNAAANLGLKFVQGPGPETTAAPLGSVTSVNGEERATYLFAVAEQL